MDKRFLILELIIFLYFLICSLYVYIKLGIDFSPSGITFIFYSSFFIIASFTILIKRILKKE